MFLGSFQKIKSEEKEGKGGEENKVQGSKNRRLAKIGDYKHIGMFSKGLGRISSYMGHYKPQKKSKEKVKTEAKAGKGE